MNKKVHIPKDIQFCFNEEYAKSIGMSQVALSEYRSYYPTLKRKDLIAHLARNTKRKSKKMGQKKEMRLLYLIIRREAGCSAHVIKNTFSRKYDLILQIPIGFLANDVAGWYNLAKEVFGSLNEIEIKRYGEEFERLNKKPYAAFDPIVVLDLPKNIQPAIYPEGINEPLVETKYEIRSRALNAIQPWGSKTKHSENLKKFTKKMKEINLKLRKQKYSKNDRILKINKWIENQNIWPGRTSHSSEMKIKAYSKHTLTRKLSSKL